MHAHSKLMFKALLHIAIFQLTLTDFKRVSERSSSSNLCGRRNLSQTFATHCIAKVHCGCAPYGKRISLCPKFACPPPLEVRLTLPGEKICLLASDSQVPHGIGIIVVALCKFDAWGRWGYKHL